MTEPPARKPALELLGRIELRGVPRADADRLLVQPKLVALLAYLALTARKAPYHRRDTLIALLWPELDQAHARTALRKAVHFLRSTLGAETIQSRGDEEIGLAPDAIDCDITAFVDDVVQGRSERAMDRYQGEMMPGFHLGGCMEFDRWLAAERTEQRQRAMTTAFALANVSEQDMAMTLSGKWIRIAARLAWDNERAMRRALAALVRAGDRSGALALYDEFAGRLKADFGAEPSPETKELVREFRGK